jgi:hypothetical protein
MAEIKTTIRGIDRLQLFTQRIAAAENFYKIVRPIIDEWQETTVITAMKYPPPPPGSKYVRTEKLKRSWRMSPITGVSTIRASVYSNGTADAGYGDYAPYVMGEGRQASIHKGRWKTDADIADETTKDVKRKIGRAAKKALEGIV